MGEHVITEVASGYLFHCPGCKCGHIFYKDHWTFNGDFVKPTFNPSLRNTLPVSEVSEAHCCHLFVRDGMIEFLSDCTHEMAGLTVPVEAV